MHPLNVKDACWSEILRDERDVACEVLGIFSTGASWLKGIHLVAGCLFIVTVRKRSIRESVVVNLAREA